MTPQDTWDEEVYGQIEVRMPGISHLRLNPVEWRPLRYHDNPPDAPAAHQFVRLWDRWHPFDLNRPLGIRAFQQTRSGVAIPLLRAVTTFSEYTHLCADIWRCPDLLGLRPPPWSKQLI